MAIPWATTLDVEWVGQHSFNTVRTVNINTVDFGAAFLPQNQNPNLVSTTPGGAALSNDLMRSYPRLRGDQHAAVQRLAHVPLAADVDPAPLP